ncbi:MAG: purine-nucleoside phosphorylase [Clostridiaceae bacterium]|nr:purine-nucleoside phosphorylase [Clostridiaceae bacterium]
MGNLYEGLKESAEFIKGRINFSPEIAIILGSGLGPLANEIENPVMIDYREIPNFPLSTVEGHEGKLVAGTLGGNKVVALKGRFHYYEGYEIPQVVFAVRVLRLLGVSHLIVTNAAGGINKAFKPGDLMIIKDHISLFAPSPLRGENIKELGVRFPDMSEAYSRKLMALCREAAAAEGIVLQEGVYAFAQGPMYETPAEIRVLGSLGADAVGMSTVPEVITARHAGINVLGISCITNMAAGILDQPLNHQEVMKTAKDVERNFSILVKRFVSEISL